MVQHEKIEISDLTRQNIVNTLVEPYYKDMVKTTINGKKLWRKLGISLETSSKIMVALGGILSFSAGVYGDDTLSFVSGAVSCMSLALLQIASFSYKENKKQGDELNILLKKLNLDTVPSMVRNEEQTTVITSSRYAPPPSSPISEQQIREQQIREQLEELKRRELQIYEIEKNQKKEYDNFIYQTSSTCDEIQKLNHELDEKMSKLYEKKERIKIREERINERERELNIIFV